MQPGVESKLSGSEREMIVEEGTARDFCVYYVLRGAIVIIMFMR